MMFRSRMPVVLAVVFATALALGFVLARVGVLGRRASVEPLVPAGAPLPSLEGAGPWIQHPLTSDSLAHRLTLIVQWSDTDPRALRVLQDAEGWHLAYARYGLRVIGVHVPDFAFGADTAVVADVARRLGLTFPIVSDPSLKLSSQIRRLVERPSFHLADTLGRIVFETGGLRADEVHRAIRAAVARVAPESGIAAEPAAFAESGSASALVPPPARVLYLGTSRVEEGPLAGAETGRAQTFTTQFRFQEEGRALVPYVVGRWKPGADELVAAHGGPENFVALRCGGNVWAVLAPPIPATTAPARVWVLADTRWLTRAEAGSDVRFDARGASYVEVASPRLFEIARCPTSCVLRLSPGAAGTRFYSFVIEPYER